MMTKEQFRVYLRSLEPKDAEITINWRNDSKIYESLNQARRFISEKTESAWIDKAISENEQGFSLRLAICLKENQLLIGLIQLLNIDMKNRSAEVTTLIGNKQYWGKGLIGEARVLLFEHAFLELGLERISNKVLETNTASLRAYEKFGSVREGILRNAAYQNGAFHNMVQFSMLRDEFISKYGGKSDIINSII
jgi:RimJ/RimL family protein N-acetyltransferase